MAGRIRTERMNYRSVGASALKPAFSTGAATTSVGRPERSVGGLANSTATKEPTKKNAIEGGDVEEKKSLKKPQSDSGRRRKDKRHLRERRHGTGVVILPGADAKNDEQADEARQTMENTKQNESIGTDELSPSPSSVTSAVTGRSSRVTGDDVDLDRRDKQQLLDRLEQLERDLDQKNKEVESLKTENKRLRDDNNALLRVVNQVSSLKAK